MGLVPDPLAHEIVKALLEKTGEPAAIDNELANLVSIETLVSRVTLLFALAMLGDDRTVAATYAGGRCLHRRDSALS